MSAGRHRRRRACPTNLGPACVSPPLQVRAAAGMKVMAYKVTLQTPDGEKVRCFRAQHTPAAAADGRTAAVRLPACPAMQRPRTAVLPPSQPLCCRWWSATATLTSWTPPRTRVGAGRRAFIAHKQCGAEGRERRAPLAWTCGALAQWAAHAQALTCALAVGRTRPRVRWQLTQSAAAAPAALPARRHRPALLLPRGRLLQLRRQAGELSRLRLRAYLVQGRLAGVAPGLASLPLVLHNAGALATPALPTPVAAIETNSFTHDWSAPPRR